MYEYTDKIIRTLAKRYIQLYENAEGSILGMDELNVLRYSKGLYSELDAITRKYFIKLARQSYRDGIEILMELGLVPVKEESGISSRWVNKILTAYDPVTKYVYSHEVLRKQERFAESVIAAVDKELEIKTALRLWNNMARQYAVTVTDEAVKRAFADNGVEKVIWITEPDEKVCGVCSDMDGAIYDIDKIPPKPHWNCRCRIMPYISFFKGGLDL